jgi:hypothetical protein
MKTMRLIGGVLISLLTLNALAQGGDKVGGGGNTINGHLIEEYVVDPHSLKAFQNELSPIIKLAGQRVEGMDSDLRSIFDKKTWYMLPVHLKELPHSITGLPASTDQTVVQTADSVWVDASEFNAMSEHSQALMLLHEVGLNLAVGNVDASSEFGGPGEHAKARKFAAAFSAMLQKSANELNDFLQGLFFLRYTVKQDLASYPELTLSQLFQRLSVIPAKQSFDSLDLKTAELTVSLDPTGQAISLGMKCHEQNFTGGTVHAWEDMVTFTTKPERGQNDDGSYVSYTSYSTDPKLAKAGDSVSFIYIQFFASIVHIFSGKMMSCASVGASDCTLPLSELHYNYCEFNL